jgi:predicted dinucleotide-binding enzyme
MNPILRTAAGIGLAVGHGTSGGQIVQDWLPRAHVVATRTPVGAEIMADTGRLPCPAVMFIAGNDAAAKAAVGQMPADLGFDAPDAGDMTTPRLLDPFGMLWIGRALMRGKGRAWAFAVVEG